jgi:hypothetical protein
VACHGGLAGRDQAAVGRADRVDHFVGHKDSIHAGQQGPREREPQPDANALGPGPAVVAHAEEYITEGGV